MCPDCSHRFTTYERAEQVALTAIKRSGRREPFDSEKLLRGLTRAAAKRPVSLASLENIVELIKQQARSQGGEIPVEEIGEVALTLLKDIDSVAYIRFASVYKNFSDADEFRAELIRLDSKEPPSKLRKEEPQIAAQLEPVGMTTSL